MLKHPQRRDRSYASGVSNGADKSHSDIESKLIVIIGIDELVPLVEFCSNNVVEKPCKIVKNKINKRNRLLRQFKKDQHWTLSQELAI